MNLDDNGSDLFIFSLPSPAVLFSACQRTWDLVPSEEAFHETTDMCIWEIYLKLRTTVGGSQVKHTPCSIALNWPPERQIMSLRYLWWTESLKSAWENSGISYRPRLLLFCVIFFFTIYLSIGLWSDSLHVTILTLILKITLFSFSIWEML